MKEIVLKRIELTNFKGQARRIEDFVPGENYIFGANGTGKTSVFDAFLWLLFGKDSKGQSEDKAKIKMLDKSGNPIWHTDNSVEATLMVDGEELTLKRTFQEKWRKPKGQAEAVYDGQKTVYSWNGNEKISAAEYKKRISDLVDEDLFKLITDPHYFASLKPDKRREIVLSMAGEVSAEEIRSANSELAKFDPGKNLSETKQVAMSTKLRCIHERDNYPARIDELIQTRTRKEADLAALFDQKQEIYQHQFEAAEKELSKLDEMQGDVTSRIDSIMQSNQERIRQLTEIDRYKSHKQAEADAAVREYNLKNADNQRKLQSLKVQLEEKEKSLDEEQKNLQKCRKDLTETQRGIELIRLEEPPIFGAVCCDKCGQELPDQDSEKEKLIEKWRELQRKRIDDLTEEGNQTYQKGVQIKDKIADLINSISDVKQEISELEDIVTVDRGYYKVDFSTDQELQAMIDAVPEEISVSEKIENENNRIRAKKEQFRKERDEALQQLRRYDAIPLIKADIEQINARCAALEKESLEVNQRIADQERIIYLCDTWVKTRTELLNKKVASKFKLVEFKMFNYTQEGNPVPTCEITVNGVDYTALNTASTINAGLDIINALIQFYQVKAPIFIDNRESVTSITAPDTQIINLSVTDGGMK